MKKLNKEGLSLDQGVKKQQNNKKSIKNKVLETFSVTFLGVRGTIPLASKEFLKYGGNTSCVKVTTGLGDAGSTFLFDAGTGIIKYGDKALLQGHRVFHLFLSHMHYDHVIGLSRFGPLFRGDCEVHIYGQSKCGRSLKDIFASFFAQPFFPVEFYTLPSLRNLHFHELNCLNSIEVNGTCIDIEILNHPQESLAFKVWNKDKSFNVVYATDHEHGTDKDLQLKKFIQNTNLFIYDSTYSDKEYINFKGWGHSTAKYGAQISKESKVKKFAIFHHDPAHNDKYLEDIILIEALKIFKGSFLAQENMTINIK